jgi:hypothetical protein
LEISLLDIKEYEEKKRRMRKRGKEHESWKEIEENSICEGVDLGG